MMICRYPTERAADGPCETCGCWEYCPDHGPDPKMNPGGHPFLGLPTRLCLQPGWVPALAAPAESDSFMGEFRSHNVLGHDYQEGEWCPTCGGDSTLWYHGDGVPTVPPCPTCKGLKAVSVQVRA